MLILLLLVCFAIPLIVLLIAIPLRLDGKLLDIANGNDKMNTSPVLNLVEEMHSDAHLLKW